MPQSNKATETQQTGKSAFTSEAKEKTIHYELTFHKGFISAISLHRNLDTPSALKLSATAHCPNVVVTCSMLMVLAIKR